jgi:hypothetical protein
MSLLFSYEAVIMVFLVLLFSYTWYRRRAFPRGPVGLPFIGNLLDMTTFELWRTVAEWGKKYGELSLHVHLMKPIFCIFRIRGYHLH